MENSLGAKLGSPELLVVEILAANDPVGLNPREIARAADLRRSVVVPTIARLERGKVLVQTGRGRRRVTGPFYRLNSEDPDVVEVVRAAETYTARTISRQLENLPSARWERIHGRN